MVQRFRDKYKVQVRVAGKIRTFTFSRKIDAEKKESDLRREKELSKAGMAMPTERILVFDFAQVFLNRFKKEHPESSWGPVERHLRIHILPEFGVRPIMTVNQPEIRDFLQRLLDEGAAPAQRNRVLQTFHRLYVEAIQDRKAIVNPVHGLPRLSERRKSRPNGWWDEPAHIEAYIEAARLEGPVYFMFANLALFCGARVSELIGLRWRSVDFTDQLIQVTEIYERATDKIVERTKGGEGVSYSLPMMPRVEVALRSWMDVTRFRKPTDHVLSRTDGRHLSYWTLKQVHERICSRAKVPHVTIHGMRATYASSLEDAGMSRGDIQELMGHVSAAATAMYLKKRSKPVVNRALQSGVGALPENVVQINQRHSSVTQASANAQDSKGKKK